MEKFFTKTRIKNLLIATALVVLGIVFCAINSKATKTLETLGYICAGLLMAVGVLLVVMYFVGYKKEVSAKSFIYGGLLFIFGLILILSISIISELLILAGGFFVSALGVIYMSKAFEKLRIGNKNIWQELAYGIVCFVLGIVLFVLYACLGAKSNVVLIFLGVSLIFAGVCLCLMIVFGRRVNVSVKKQIAHEERKEQRAKEERKKTVKTTKKSSK